MINQTLTKTRSDDVLGNLSEDDRERVLQWLAHTSYREVLRQIAEPAPEGFGLKIHYNSLRRFHLKYLPTLLSVDREDQSPDWKGLARDTTLKPIDLQDVIRESLEKQVVVALEDGNTNSRKAIQLMECLLRWRSQELAQRKNGSTHRPPLQSAPSGQAFARP